MAEKNENSKWPRFASGLHTHHTHQRMFDGQGEVRRAERDLANDFGQPRRTTSKPLSFAIMNRSCPPMRG